MTGRDLLGVIVAAAGVAVLVAAAALLRRVFARELHWILFEPEDAR